MISPIPGFPGYFADDQGFILSGVRCGRKPRGFIGPRFSESLTRLAESSGARYRVVHLRRDGQTFTRYIHRLILETFVGPCPEGMECLHRNGDRRDCSLANLRWGTSLENSADTILHGRQTFGELVPQAKLKTEDIAAIEELRRQGLLHREIAVRFGVSRTAISLILGGKTWKRASLSPQYAKGT